MEMKNAGCSRIAKASNTHWMFLPPPRPASHTLQLPLDATNLGTFERQIVHQPLLIKDEPDYRTADAVGVVCPPAPTVMMAIDPSTPTFQPSVRWKLSSAAPVMNMMIADRA
jgi:hypothetical protein